MGGMYLILILFILGVGGLVQYRLRSKFKAYSAIPLYAGLTGREVAEKMLKEHGIQDVKIVSVKGMLSDHYNPLKKTVNLSPEVYQGSSVASAAVAAHECGHAVQHARAYAFLQMRSTLVPVVSVTSGLVQWVLLAGILMIEAFPGLLLAGIGMLALTALFSLITLPVEFDASRRALVWLQGARITDQNQFPKAKDALHWAAMTYVVAAIGAVMTLLYYVMMFLNRRND